MNVPLVLAPLATAVVAVTAAAFFFAPEMSRPGVFFAVRVADDFRRSEKAKRILRAYRWAIVAATVVAGGIAYLGATVAPVGVPLAAVWMLAAFLGAVIVARRAILPHAVPVPTVREASLGVYRPPVESRAWIQALPFLPFAIAGWIVWKNWDRFPARFAVHRDLWGRPEAWAVKSPLREAGFFCVGIILCAILAAVWNLAARFARRPSATGRAGAGEVRFRTGFARMGLVLESIIAVAFSTTILSPLWGPHGARRLFPWFPLVYLVAMGGVIAWCIHLSRSRGRFPASTPDDLAPDACWKAGVFYMNPNDPALVVERRIGFGYTLNFAHPIAWALLAAVFLVPISIVLLRRF